MTLAELVDGLDDQDPDATTYAPPGDVGADTPVTVAVEADNGTPPAGLRPVLEVFLAQEAVEVWRACATGASPRPPTRSPRSCTTPSTTPISRSRRDTPWGQVEVARPSHGRERTETNAIERGWVKTSEGQSRRSDRLSGL